MQLFLSFLISFFFLPAFAQENFNGFSGKQKIVDFDSLNFVGSKHKKINYGDQVEYIVDYDPEDKDHHHSEKGILFHDDDGHFYGLDKDTIVVSKNRSKARLVGNNSSDATGNKRTLVIAVADPDANADSQIYSRTFVENAYFGESGPNLNTYYKEVSSNRVSFSGVVDERLFVIRGLCAGGNIFASGRSNALINIVDEEIDLSPYDRLSFVFPEDRNCLGGALGVATLGKIQFVNSFGKNTDIGINFNVSAGVNANNDIYFLKVIAHEFGHNFGLQHDNASSCGEDIFDGDCESLEYGGVHSIMGFSPNLAHVNAIHQRDLKWLTNAQIEVLDTPNTRVELTLNALAADIESGFKSIRIRRNDGLYYTVEYRSQLGMERQEYAVKQLTYGGLQIYLNNDDNVNISGKSDSALINSNFLSFANNDGSQYTNLLETTSFTPSDIFYDPVSDIRITTLSANSQEARVLVEKAFVDDGGGVATASEDPYVHQAGQISLSSKGITKTKPRLIYNGDILTNAKIKISIPKAYRKLVKVKKKASNLVSNSVNVNFKFAAEKKFERKLPLNSDGQYSVPVNVKVFDTRTKAIIYQGISRILLNPSAI